jgi:ribosomal subunit interface protein
VIEFTAFEGVAMEIPPQISFRGMDPSPAIEARIREHIDRLGRFHDHITSCNVVVDAPHVHSHKGKIYHVRIDITVPGTEIVVNREPELNHAHEDVYVAIRDGFRAATRQLEDVARKMSGHRTKAHAEAAHGVIARLMSEEGYGFITAPDGGEVFFSREAVSPQNGPSLAVGTEVHFTVREGEKGPYASAVTPV